MQQSELDFIYTLRQSSAYITEHRDKTCVVYLPGELLASSESLATLSQDIGLLHHLGMRLVLVMGASVQLNKAFQNSALPLHFEQQFRITPIHALPLFQQTIGLLRSQLEASLSQASAQQTEPPTIVAGNWVIAQPKGVLNGVDFQHTGTLRKIRLTGIQSCLQSKQIALLTPIAYSLTGETFNLNTFEQACEVASRLKADKLMVYTSEENLQSLPKQMSIPELKQTIAQTQQSRLHTLLSQISKTNYHVKRVHLLNQNEPSAMLMELFSRDGLGTLIFSDRYHQVRTATIEDVGGILSLIGPLEEQGVLVKRSRERLELEIKNFWVIERDQLIIGCAALYPCEQQMGELACVAVHPFYQGQKIGDELLQAIENQAKQNYINRLFLLTTQTTHWFLGHGFYISDRSALPPHKQPLYNYQRQSKVLIKELNE